MEWKVGYISQMNHLNWEQQTCKWLATFSLVNPGTFMSSRIFFGKAPELQKKGDKTIGTLKKNKKNKSNKEQPGKIMRKLS